MPPAQRSVDQSTRPGYRIEALSKGLRLLALFTEQRPSWRISDMTGALGVPMPTVYRLVMTLVEDGYLEQLLDGQYRPAVKALTLGSAALRGLDLVELATPRLQQLAEATGETVNLAVLTDDRVLYLVRLRNSNLVTANIQVGSTLPAPHASIGKLLLAFLDEDDLTGRLSPTSFETGGGPNAKRSLEELRPDLEAIRRQGWSMQDEELASGLRSVAAPVRGMDGRVVAGANIALSSRDWPTARIVRELKPQLIEACAEISQLLGWTAP